MRGYRGKILRVDLSAEKIEIENLDMGLARMFIGGAGLGVRMLFDMIDKDTDPLGTENPLILMTGPFAGTAVPTGSKATFIARSPKTGLLGYSTFGGHLGADLKFAGLDGVVITGSAETPKYLFIDDSNVEIRNASHLWGKDTEVTWNTLKEESGFKSPGVARIGVAGENLVKYACIMIDHHRAAGRTGMGAVMGSKKLKAIVVNGTDKSVPVADSEGLDEKVKSLNEDAKSTPTFSLYSEIGTAGFVDMATAMFGSLPIAYYTEAEFDSYNISGTTVKETILVGRRACYRCPIACGRVIEISEGKYAIGRFAGPELEVTGTMGTLFKNNDLEALAFVNKQFDLLGIDTISGGNVISLACYLYTIGRVSADFDGIALQWGDMDAAIKLIDKIALRDGIGDVMAEGARQLAKYYGSESLAVEINGLETPMHDPRAFSGMAVAYATSPRGACHMAADMYNFQMGVEDEGFGIMSQDRFANEADLVARAQDLRCFTNSAVICHFYPLFSNDLADLFTLVTGETFTVQDIKICGERIFTMMRLLNLRLGYDTKNEGLSELLLKPLEGPTEGHVPDIEAHLDKWYAYRGWDRTTGRPPKEKLEELGIADLDIA